MYTFLDDLGSWVSARLTSASEHDSHAVRPGQAPGAAPETTPAAGD